MISDTQIIYERWLKRTTSRFKDDEINCLYDLSKDEIHKHVEEIEKTRKEYFDQYEMERW